MLRSFAESGVFGESYGAGEVRVVWLHGWARSAQDFADAARQLAQRGVASLALDLPGSGASPAPMTAGGARMYADLLAPVLSEISSRPLVVVGHSFGGRIGVVLAAEHPELVGHLVLTGVPLVRLSPPRRPRASYRVARWLARRHLISEARFEAVRQRHGSSDYRNARGVMRDVLVATMQENYDSDLSTLRSPVTCVWGEEDREAPIEVARRALALVESTSSLVPLSGVGHFVPLEATTALVEATYQACRP